jgi:hypothetical protein
VHQQRRCLARGSYPCKTNFLKQAEQFEDDYDDNDYSNYVEDASVHAVTDIRLGFRWLAFMQTERREL